MSKDVTIPSIRRAPAEPPIPFVEPPEKLHRFAGWEPKDILWGALFCFTGVLFVMFFWSLIGSEYWPVLLVGGFSWIMGPVLVFLGLNAIYCGIGSLFRRY